jgi:hypothetical protein
VIASAQARSNKVGRNSLGSICKMWQNTTGSDVRMSRWFGYAPLTAGVSREIG